MKSLSILSVMVVCLLPVVSNASIFVSGSTSKLAGTTCNASIKSI